MLKSDMCHEKEMNMAIIKPTKPAVPNKKKVDREPGLREASSLGHVDLSVNMKRLPERFYSQDQLDIGSWRTKKKPGAP